MRRRARRRRAPPPRGGRRLPRRPPRARAHKRDVTAPPVRARGGRHPFFFDPGAEAPGQQVRLLLPVHVTLPSPPLSSFPSPWIPTCRLAGSRVSLASPSSSSFLYPVEGVLGWGEIKNRSCPWPVVRLSRARLVTLCLGSWCVVNRDYRELEFLVGVSGSLRGESGLSGRRGDRRRTEFLVCCRLKLWFSEVLETFSIGEKFMRFLSSGYRKFDPQITSSHGLGAYDESDNEDIDRAIALSLSEEQNKGKAVDIDYNLEEDEQLARALQESLNADSPPRQNIPVENVPSEPPRELPPILFASSGSRTCAGCKNPIGHGRFLSCMDSVWHPQCFRCFACNKPISEYEFAMHEDQPYHKSCYKDFFHPKCDVCKNFIPTNRNGLIEYRAHPFWMQKYCPSHEDDGTPRCCSCERMEPMDIKYITLDDGRKLCLECLNSSIMDTPECQQLYMDIQEFFEGLNMKVEQQVPILLVERQALNEALETEKNGHHLPETRGLCLSEEQIVRTILRRPIIGPGNRIIDMITAPYKLERRCEVTAILILYGLPRLQTGSILAHEMMHAYLRLKGFRSLSPQVEEGICQVLSHMWLESEIIFGSSIDISATSVASSSSSSSTPTTSKKGAKTEFEKKLGAFIKHQIETDSSEAYGDGFRAANRAVESYGLRSTLNHMKMTGSFPY
uniref:LIM zinc-binding domain-containing protein n=2 Tax=Oryza rufipogon TaxID=4529 RepID=A0A0E0RJJ4_ORYRU